MHKPPKLIWTPDGSLRPSRPVGHGILDSVDLKWAASSVGRAQRSQRWGRGFESHAVHQPLLPDVSSGMNQLTPRQQLDLLEKMRADWDSRARENAWHYVENSCDQWTSEEFFATGERALAEDILTDPGNIYQGREPSAMRVLEIGCGAGRVTRALARHFGEVHGVDVSGEMVQRASAALAAFPNARVYQNNGCDLSVIPAGQFDFAYSTVVFQHIPSREIIENYVREVCRLLRPGALFKFQVQGFTGIDPVSPTDTWNGVAFSAEEAAAMADRCGFEMRYSYGAGEQYFWLWFFKRQTP